MKNTTTTPKDVTFTMNGSVLTASFANGKRITVDYTILSPAIAQSALMHGLKQKIGDAAAIARDTLTGATASINDKYNACLEVAERITSATAPSWNKIREGGTGVNRLLMQAIATITGKPVEAITAQYEAMTTAQRAALAAHPKIAAEYAALMAAASNIDADDLLASLMDEEGAE